VVTAVSTVAKAEMHDVLVVDADADMYAGVLGGSFRVVTASRAAVALEHLAQRVPSAIVVELDGAEGPAINLIARARRFSLPPAILVTTSDVERVPDAIAAGCDSVLLKPFAPNLICSRVSRLVRSHHESLQQQSVPSRGDLMSAGSMRDWPTTHCPYCDHEGVTGFEYASHRRAWYACLSCKKVWMAKRRD